MTALVQIFLLALTWFQASGSPLFQGISFHRSFNISLKPLPIKPLTFIREKWTPFGVFGKKHSILRRDLGGTELQEVPIISLPKIEESSMSVFRDRLEILKPTSAPVPPVHEETEPLTVAPLYVQPAVQPPSQIITSLNEISPVPAQVVVIEQSITPPKMLFTPVQVEPALGIISTIEKSDTITPEFRDLPVSNYEVGPPKSTDNIPTLFESVRPLQPVFDTEIQSGSASPQLNQQPVILLQSELPPKPQLPTESVPSIKMPVSFSSIDVTPFHQVPLIVPPELKASSEPLPKELLLREITPELNENKEESELKDRSQNLLTNIFRVEPGLQSSNIQSSETPPLESNSITETPKVQTDGPFIRGSKLALYFGNIIFGLMSQLFSNARITLDRLTSSTPVFSN